MMASLNPDMLWAGLALLAGMALSFLYSGIETGTYVLNKIRLDLRAEQGAKPARSLRRNLARPGEALTVLMLGNNVGNYLASAGMVLLLSEAGWRHPEWSAMLILTPTLFVFCELFPKNLFHRYSETLTYALSGFLTLSRWVFKLTGLAWLTQALVWGILRIAGRRFGPTQNPLNRAGHVAGILAEGRASGVLTHAQSIIAERVMNIGHVHLHDVMMPLEKAVLVSQDVGRDELRRVLAEHGHPRVGVYAGQRDNIVGLLSIYDVLLEEAEPPTSLMSPALMIPGERSITDAMVELQRRRQTMAFVLDEQGRCVGLVTVKDLVEEIVGELEEF